MSKATEKAMLHAIKAHFRDQGIEVHGFDGFKVRAIVDSEHGHHGMVYHSSDDYTTRVVLDAEGTSLVHGDYIVRHHSTDIPAYLPGRYTHEQAEGVNLRDLVAGQDKA